MTLAKQITVVVALTLVVAVAAGASTAQTGGLSCGDTITVDTTLDRDLLNCPNNGILIGADDITLDLNGHVIDGNRSASRGCDPRKEFCDSGVGNNEHDGVTVRNGSVRQFEFGVIVGNARENRVLDISSSQNTFFGFLVTRSSRILVRGSSGSRNIAPEGDGMGLFDSHHVRIVDSEFRRNPGPGIHVAASTDNLIKGNLFSHSSPALFLGGESRAEKADRNHVRGNRFVRSGAGVLLGWGDRNLIARNRFSRVGDGIAIENARGNLVARNVILDARKSGIYLGLNEPPIGGGHNVVRRNVVRRSGGDGFKVRSTDQHSLLIGNLARRSGDDGFAVRSSSTKLVRNRAVGNDALGIKAVFGVTDGRGNLASGNGDPRQCVNVRCR